MVQNPNQEQRDCTISMSCIYQFQQRGVFWYRNTTSSVTRTVGPKHTGRLCKSTMERNTVILAHGTPSGPERTIANSTLAFDQPFTTTAKGLLLLAEIVRVADCEIVGV